MVHALKVFEELQREAQKSVLRDLVRLGSPNEIEARWIG